MEFHSLKYTCVGKNNIICKPMWWILIRNTAFFLEKFADLRFADWDTNEICGFAICRLIITNLRTCKLRTGTPQKFPELRYQNECKNSRICDMQTNKENLHAHLGINLKVFKVLTQAFLGCFCHFVFCFLFLYNHSEK